MVKKKREYNLRNLILIVIIVLAVLLVLYMVFYQSKKVSLSPSGDDDIPTGIDESGGVIDAESSGKFNCAQYNGNKVECDKHLDKCHSFDSFSKTFCSGIIRFRHICEKRANNIASCEDEPIIINDICQFTPASSKCTNTKNPGFEGDCTKTAEGDCIESDNCKNDPSCHNKVTCEIVNFPSYCLARDTIDNNLCPTNANEETCKSIKIEYNCVLVDHNYHSQCINK